MQNDSWILDIPTWMHMGQFLHDGNFGCFMSLFWLDLWGRFNPISPGGGIRPASIVLNQGKKHLFQMALSCERSEWDT